MRVVVVVIEVAVQKSNWKCCLVMSVVVVVIEEVMYNSNWNVAK